MPSQQALLSARHSGWAVLRAGGGLSFCRVLLLLPMKTAGPGEQDVGTSPVPSWATSSSVPLAPTPLIVLQQEVNGRCHMRWALGPPAQLTKRCPVPFGPRTVGCLLRGLPSLVPKGGPAPRVWCNVPLEAAEICYGSSVTQQTLPGLLPHGALLQELWGVWRLLGAVVCPEWAAEPTPPTLLQDFMWEAASLPGRVCTHRTPCV